MQTEAVSICIDVIISNSKLNTDCDDNIFNYALTFYVLVGLFSVLHCNHTDYRDNKLLHELTLHVSLA